MNAPLVKHDFKYQQIFVLGAPRSGTSAMSYILKNCFGYAGHNEGHVFPLLQSWDELVGRYANDIEREQPPRVTTFQALGVDRFQSMLAESLRDNINALYGQKAWIDKTPGEGMISCAPLLMRYFPECFFVFMKRNGLSNILSQQKRFNRLIPQACRYWAGAMRKWLLIRRSIEGCYVEIDQTEMASDSAASLRPLLHELKVSPDCGRVIEDYLKEVEVERSLPSGFNVQHLDETNWSEQEVKIFKDICSEMMFAYGYWSQEEFRKNLGSIDASVLAKNVHNKWFKPPEDIGSFPIHFHANQLGDNPATLIFPAFETQFKPLLSLHFILNAENKKGLRFRSTVCSVQQPLDTFNCKELDLLPGDQEIAVELPSADMCYLKFELLPGAGARSNVCCEMTIQSIELGDK